MGHIETTNVYKPTRFSVCILARSEKEVRDILHDFDYTKEFLKHSYTDALPEEKDVKEPYKLYDCTVKVWVNFDVDIEVDAFSPYDSEEEATYLASIYLWEIIYNVIATKKSKYAPQCVKGYEDFYLEFDSIISIKEFTEKSFIYDPDLGR